eukprot:10231269-Alexandrium_andersonii.AAC.1
MHAWHERDTRSQQSTKSTNAYVVSERTPRRALQIMCQRALWCGCRTAFSGTSSCQPGPAQCHIIDVHVGYVHLPAASRLAA